MLKQGVFRGEKVLYPDGIGCCIWEPLGEDEEMGLCFDFSYEDIEDLIGLLRQMTQVDAEVFQEES